MGDLLPSTSQSRSFLLHFGHLQIILFDTFLVLSSPTVLLSLPEGMSRWNEPANSCRTEPRYRLAATRAADEES